MLSFFFFLFFLTSVLITCEIGPKLILVLHPRFCMHWTSRENSSLSTAMCSSGSESKKTEFGGVTYSMLREMHAKPCVLIMGV